MGELKFVHHADGFKPVGSCLIRYDHANST
jgi:hypothetical protein